MSANWQHRWHPLREEWVQIAAQSSGRPWSGARVEDAAAAPPRHDPGCYLCPGVTRASGDTNPDYTGPFAFDNDFANLRPDAEGEETGDADPLRRTARPRGRCRVLCWSERHDLTLADLGPKDMLGVVQLWRDEFVALAREPGIRQVIIFENKGVEIGVSNLHPHGQIYATDFVTDTATRQRNAQVRYRAERGTHLLQDLLVRPEYRDELFVAGNASWRAIVPFFARFPFEVWIVPERAFAHIDEASDAELADLAEVYGAVVRQFDQLFQRRTPHNTLLHNAPCDGHEDNAAVCFHIVVQCPLRAPGMLKYMGGYEQSAGNIVNPVQPEDAAKRLRDAGASV
ncbi:MAG: galactose-1-phosphate uridylyltransferase [Pseudomonadota bacterium]